MKIFFALLFIISTCSVVYADECNTNIKSTDTYQELNIILNCLSSKIVKLENEVETLKGTYHNDKQSSEQNPVIFENKYLSIYNVIATRDNSYNYITFTVKSKNDKDIEIYMKDIQYATISDNLGNSDRLYDIQGISRSLPTTTLINPGSFVKVSLKFGIKVKGDTISFSSFIHCIHDISTRDENKFTFGAENIKIAKQ